jgi:hypothetical protein
MSTPTTAETAAIAALEMRSVPKANASPMITTEATRAQTAKNSAMMTYIKEISASIKMSTLTTAETAELNVPGDKPAETVSA